MEIPEEILFSVPQQRQELIFSERPGLFLVQALEHLFGMGAGRMAPVVGVEETGINGRVR
jgi:hypothetical protein